MHWLSLLYFIIQIFKELRHPKAIPSPFFMEFTYKGSALAEPFLSLDKAHLSKISQSEKDAFHYALFPPNNPYQDHNDSYYKKNVNEPPYRRKNNEPDEPQDYEYNPNS